MSTNRNQRWKDLHFEATVVDLHAHPSLKMALFHRDLTRRYRAARAFFWPLGVRTNFPRLEKGGVDVLLSAVYAPEKRLLDDLPFLKLLRFVPSPFVQRTWNQLIRPPYFTVILRLLDELEAQVRAHSGRRGIALATSVKALDDMLRQGAQGPIAIVHTVEGAHGLEGETGSESEILANLEHLFERGVALLTLAHFYPNRTVMPVFPYPEFALPLLPQKRIDRLWEDLDPTRGLTSIGRRVVERMLELGMLIDVSHCTPTARRTIYEMADARGARCRVVATHVGAYAINPSPYNLEDWEIRWIAGHGGVIGVIFMNYWLMPRESGLGLNFISRTIEQFVSAAGGSTDHVAIGTDFDGFTDPPDDVRDASELPRFTARLMAEIKSTAARKYSDDDIEKILGGNALRVLREGWGKVQ